MPQVWTQVKLKPIPFGFLPVILQMQKPHKKFILQLRTICRPYKWKLISSKNGAARTDYGNRSSHAPYLFMMAVGEFSIVKDSYTKDGSEIEINYYVEPEYERMQKVFWRDTKYDYFFPNY